MVSRFRPSFFRVSLAGRACRLWRSRSGLVGWSVVGIEVLGEVAGGVGGLHADVRDFRFAHGAPEAADFADGLAIGIEGEQGAFAGGAWLAGEGLRDRDYGLRVGGADADHRSLPWRRISASSALGMARMAARTAALVTVRRGSGQSLRHCLQNPA